MNQLSPEHLHLLLDEPIYVLESDLREHFESHEHTPELNSAPETEQPTDFKGENKKGIMIIIENKSDKAVAAEDEEFLFKGLNALNIFAEDAAIISKLPATGIPEDIKHNKRIMFSSNPVEENLYHRVSHIF